MKGSLPICMSEPDNYLNETAFPFRDIVQTSSIIFYHCDLEEGFPLLYMSPNVQPILGYGNEEFMENKSLWLERIHSDDCNNVLSSYNEILEEKQKVIEFRFQHKKGHYVWLRDEIKLITDEQGNPESVAGSSIEITDQKEAETKLQMLNQTLEERIKERTSKLATTNRKLKKQIQYRNKAEKKLKKQNEQLKLQELAIDNLNDMVVVTKAPKNEPLNSEIIFVNKSFEEFTGYRADEVKGRTPTFLHGPQTSQKIVARINKQISNHESLREEFINYKKDDTPYWVELDMSHFPTDEENYDYWVGINRDITKRKKAEQKLEESEQRYRAFAELSFDAIFEINPDGTILKCNKRATELFGYSREELIGMNTLKLTPEKYRDQQPDTITNIATTGDETWEHTYQKKDGTCFPTEIHTQTYEIEGQKSLVAYVRDNTAHKKYENTIRRSLKEKETLLAEVHHRVKNNLAIISGLLEMQVFNTEDDQLLEKLRESQSRIQSIAMVHEKLYSSESFSEIALDQYINELLDMIVDSVNLEKNIKVEKDMDSVPLVVGQAIPCGLLLNELITNSFKHAFRDLEEGKIHISLKQHDHHISLSVRDNGIGLPEDFDIKSESSLGMTLINTLVKQLGGDLQIISDGGSCFQLTFEIDK